MKYKDLVIFIIKNNLLDEELDNMKISKSFLTLEQASVKLGVSISSLESMAKIGMVDFIEYDNQLYFHESIELTNLKRR